MEKVTNETGCPKTLSFYCLTCSPRNTLFAAPGLFCLRMIHHLLSRQSFAEPDCSGTVGGGTLENTSVMTSDQGGSQLAVKNCAGLAASSFTSCPPPFDIETVVKRLVEAWEAWPPPSSSVHCLTADISRSRTPDALVSFYLPMRD